MKEEKRVAQIKSAKASLVTNLICMSVFFVGNSFIALLPVHISSYFGVMVYTFVKGLMPVLSTVANFGTVRSVYLQFKAHISQLHA
jgi:hypothetical protein